MKKIFKRMTIFLCAVASVFSLAVSASALSDLHEYTLFEEEEVKYSQLTVYLHDQTGGAFQDAINVSVAGWKPQYGYTFHLAEGERLINAEVVQGGYNLAINFVSKGEYLILHADGSKISSWKIEDDTFVEHWFIVPASAEGEAVTGEAESVDADLNISAEQYAEAKALWVDFLQKTTPLKEKEENGEAETSTVLREVEFYDYIASYYAGVTGRDREEYLNMSLYERYLWWCTYIYPQKCYRSEYDLSEWNSYTIEGMYSSLKYYEKSNEMAEAYKKLMEWQYYYVREHGEFFSFVDVFGLDAEIDVTEETTATSAEASEETTAEITTAAPDITEVTEATTEAETSIWDGFFNALKDNIFSICLGVVLVIAIIIFIVYTKKKNIDIK